MRVAEVAVEPARVALHAGAQAHRVVHLIRLAGRDQLPDPVDGGLVPLARRRRHPRSLGGRGDALVAGERQGGLLGALEHREPGEGQGRERVVGVAGADDEVGVEAGRGFVGHEPRDPQAAPGRRLGRFEGGDDLTGACRLQHADRFHEPERGRGAGEVVESRFEHAGHDTVSRSYPSLPPRTKRHR